MLESMRSKSRGMQFTFGLTHGSGGKFTFGNDHASVSVTRVTPTGTGLGVRATITGAQLENNKRLHSTTRIRLGDMNQLYMSHNRADLRTNAHFCKMRPVPKVFPTGQPQSPDRFVNERKLILASEGAVRCAPTKPGFW
jgi:hypothetical protein